jgi:hypothetical protein
MRFYTHSMNGRFLPFLFAAFFAVSGCLTSSHSPLAARRHAYERLLGFIEPGMTRKQLYALLPPRLTPSATSPTMLGIGGVYIYALHTEKHPLDRDFSLYVEYRLANPREYPSALSPAPTSTKRMLSKQNPDDELATRPTLLGPKVPHAKTVIEFSMGTYDELRSK